MPSQVPQAAIDQIEKTKGVLASATTLLTTLKDRIQAAVNAALDNGATAEQLAPVQDEVNSLATSTDDLAAAVAANQ